jgi:hypothetical protein
MSARALPNLVERVQETTTRGGRTNKKEEIAGGAFRHVAKQKHPQKRMKRNIK